VVAQVMVKTHHLHHLQVIMNHQRRKLKPRQFSILLSLCSNIRV
jgi:hypothetical protein